MDIKIKLNPQQWNAVSTESQITRVIAGAGTGKTRVLTYRVAYLMVEQYVKPWSILAITFTNKAAAEMLSRVKEFFPEEKSNMWILTFHSFCARFLRYEIKVYPSFTPNFHILDEQDQETLIKGVMMNAGYKRSDEATKMAISFIQSNKGAGLLPDDAIFDEYPPMFHGILRRAYEEYEYEKTKSNSLDFDDLILVTLKILKEFPNIRLAWQKRFQHILVDEFQDTDYQQYALIKYLMGFDTSLYVVGDPDQTIYTWRGARQEIILNLEKDYPELETVILDTNYRSTQEILTPANKLISKNKNRIHKDLRSNLDFKGMPVEVHPEELAHLEANYICRKINSLLRDGFSYSDIAVMYRSNYLSLNLEKQLVRYNIPYAVYGNIKFYQRQEIKDVIAYLNITDNIRDDVSFRRILNVPKRGIGDIAERQIVEDSLKHGLSISEYLMSDHATVETKPKILETLRSMLTKVSILQDSIHNFQSSSANLDSSDLVKKAFFNLFDEINYFKYIEESFDNSDDRRENIESLLADIVNFMKRDRENPFSEYLANVALMSAADEIKEENTIKVMTVHIAKGLEFPVVFLYGFMEGVFPSNRSVLEGGDLALEEERRLAYVAMTRAKRQLYITYNTDFSYVTKSRTCPSSFLQETDLMPVTRGDSSRKAFKDFFEQQVRERETNPGSEPPVRNTIVNNGIEWIAGDRLNHVRLGKGTIVKIEPGNKLVIEFDSGKTATIIGSNPAVSKEKEIWS